MSSDSSSPARTVPCSSSTTSTSPVSTATRQASLASAAASSPLRPNSAAASGSCSSTSPPPASTRVAGPAQRASRAARDSTGVDRASRASSASGRNRAAAGWSCLTSAVSPRACASRPLSLDGFPPMPPASSPRRAAHMAETLTSGLGRLDIDARRQGVSRTAPATLVPVPGGNPLPSRPTARLAALTVAAVCSAASTVVLTTPAHAESVRIHDIQGDTRVSPFAGKQVTDVTGIVTGIRTYGSSRGFWIQDPAPDADPATSEGVFVFTSSTPQGVAVGDEVSVSGTVSSTSPAGPPPATSRSPRSPSPPSRSSPAATRSRPRRSSTRARSRPRTRRRATRRPLVRSTPSRCGRARTPSTCTSRWRA